MKCLVCSADVNNDEDIIICFSCGAIMKNTDYGFIKLSIEDIDEERKKIFVPLISMIRSRE